MPIFEFCDEHHQFQKLFQLLKTGKENWGQATFYRAPLTHRNDSDRMIWGSSQALICIVIIMAWLLPFFRCPSAKSD